MWRTAGWRRRIGEMLSPDQLEQARKLSIKGARAVVTSYYGQGNPTGGYLHVVVDDGNIDDENIEGCIEEAKTYGDDSAVAIGEMLLAFPLDERRLICADFRDPELVALIGEPELRHPSYLRERGL
jgi:hypothetical protein